MVINFIMAIGLSYDQSAKYIECRDFYFTHNQSINNNFLLTCNFDGDVCLSRFGYIVVTGSEKYSK